MKKITLIAAVLGASYFANAQVGIGTPNPMNSTQLEVKATDKGVLIPRVVLTDLKVYSPIIGDKVESLLVYNIANTTTVPNGFYYWTIDTANPNGYWNRITDAKYLNELLGDLSEIKKFINYIIPTNPGNDTGSTDIHTTIVYENGNFYLVKYDVLEQVYKKEIIDLTSFVAGLETKTFVREVKDSNSKVTGFIYFSEQTIIDWLAAGTTNTIDNIPNDADGAIAIDVKGTVVNNIQEILESPISITIDGNTFTTVEEYIQYISQLNGNVIYTQIQDPDFPTDPLKKIWVFQYWDDATKTYQTINLKDLIAGLETNTAIVTYNKKQYYLSEAYIKAGGETNPGLWTAVPIGAIHLDVVGGVINNIQEILESPTTITITTAEGNKTFTTVEEYIQYISQFSNGNVIYTQIQDPAFPSDDTKKIWVFQYWDEVTNTYKTIDLESLIAGLETKTQIMRTEVLTDGTLPAFVETRTAPVVGDVRKGEIFYQYKAEGSEVDYINLTEDMITSITNNEEIKTAISNILNNGGNVYFGDHDDEVGTPDTFYQIITDSTGIKTNQEIVLPASIIVNTIKNDTNLTIKQALGDHLNNTTNIVYTGNTYNNKKVYLAKRTTSIQEYSAIAAPVVISGKTITEVLSIKLLKGLNVITASTTDVEITAGGTIKFNIGVGNQYFMLPIGEYDVIVEFASDEIVN